ncbi:flagellar motor protein MotB [Thalassotalea eurytherma]|uniref:Cell envelope biogenesis protein OmpA n=1 Tax=Thalassotalea eurytherma TaxID=1144278 RepID=A0ABQ6H8S9_9GAMM|nr:flagellar motor protein MotB [Thalassotalea eurytherma]GLX83170.1 cell envelope biogenesis protein OmpA [Thalassotalea eurytherma]
MRRNHESRHDVAQDNVHRWLISYADYMTLLFALFVVLYAMAIIHEEPFETMTDSIGRVFQSDQEQTKNRGQGEDILPVNSSRSETRLYGDGILEEAGPELTDGKNELSNIEKSEVGTNLESLEEELHTALYELVESGYAELEIDGDWLEIELSSGLLFPSGSASATNNAEAILSVITPIIKDVTNYLRVRGYTDNQPINTEVFESNWELSVARAVAILRLLEEQEIVPARMAIEGYGQYSPKVDNNSTQGLLQNRRVVIAISKYGLERENVIDTPSISVKDIELIKQEVDSAQQGNRIRIVELENGGIRITTRDEDNQDN